MAWSLWISFLLLIPSPGSNWSITWLASSPVRGRWAELNWWLNQPRTGVGGGVEWFWNACYQGRLWKRKRREELAGAIICLGVKRKKSLHRWHNQPCDFWTIFGQGAISEVENTKDEFSFGGPGKRMLTEPESQHPNPYKMPFCAECFTSYDIYWGLKNCPWSFLLPRPFLGCNWLQMSHCSSSGSAGRAQPLMQPIMSHRTNYSQEEVSEVEKTRLCLKALNKEHQIAWLTMLWALWDVFLKFYLICSILRP